MNTDSVAFLLPDSPSTVCWCCYFGEFSTLAEYPIPHAAIYINYICLLCSNSKLNTYDHVFNCLQNNQWGGFKKPMTRSPPLFSYPFLFSFCLKYVTFSGYWALRKETRLLFIYERPLFLYLSLERKSQMCLFQKEHWINLHNLQSVCLPSCLSDMPVCTPNVCPLSIETLIFVFPDLLKFVRMQFCPVSTMA